MKIYKIVGRQTNIHEYTHTITRGDADKFSFRYIAPNPGEDAIEGFLFG